jgi:Do/DeqQ family serine protease
LTLPQACANFRPFGFLKTMPQLPKAALTALLIASAAHAQKTPDLTIDPSPLPPGERGAPTFAPVVREVAPSVVNIYTNKTTRSGGTVLLQDPFNPFFGIPFEQVPQERREQSLGSGVIVSRDGYILTNHHVIAGADQILVALHGDKSTHEARLIGTDPQTDIAVIKIEKRDAPAITLADSDQVEVGDVALAIGNPFGIGQTVTMGIVSAKGRRGMGIVDYEDFIQTDASINPGNSGGALVDARGRLIGINQSILSRTGGNQGVGFSVPINLAKHVMASLIANGRVERGHLGVMVQPVTQELAAAFGLKETHGALIGGVGNGSPGERSGLKPGDVILEFDGDKVEGSAELRLMVSKASPGSEVPARIWRDGKAINLKLQIGSLDGQGANAQNPAATGSPLDGAQLTDLDPQLRQSLRVPPGLDGAVVAQIEPGSPAARTGLQPGDVIFELNRQPVPGPRELLSALRQSPDSRHLLRAWSRGNTRYLVIE